MLLDVVGQQIERGLDVGFVVEAGSRRSQAFEPMASLAIVGQQAVDVAARDPAVAGEGALVVAMEP